MLKQHIFVVAHIPSTTTVILQSIPQGIFHVHYLRSTGSIGRATDGGHIWVPTLGWFVPRDAWHHLGGMSSEAAMEAYVDELKRVAKEVSVCPYTSSHTQ